MATKRVKPLRELSEDALAALCKLLYTGKVLCPGTVEPYQELQRAGYAFFVRGGYTANFDNREEILAAMGFRRSSGRKR